MQRDQEEVKVVPEAEEWVPGMRVGWIYRRGSHGSGSISSLNRRAGGRFSCRYRQGTKSTFTTGFQCLANKRTSESMGSLTICQGVCRISLIGGWCYNLGSCLMARTPHQGGDNWGQVGTGAVKSVKPRQRARKRNLRLEKLNAG